MSGGWKKGFPSRELKGQSLQKIEQDKIKVLIPQKEESPQINLSFYVQNEEDLDGDSNTSTFNLKDKIHRLKTAYCFINSEKKNDEDSEKAASERNQTSKNLLENIENADIIEEEKDLRADNLEVSPKEKSNPTQGVGDHRNSNSPKKISFKFKKSIYSRIGVSVIDEEKKSPIVKNSDKDFKSFGSQQESLDAETKLLYRLISNLYLTKKFISRLQGQANLRRTKFLRDKHYNLINDLSVWNYNLRARNEVELGLKRVVSKIERSISFLMRFRAVGLFRMMVERMLEIKEKYLLTFHPSRIFHKVWDALMIFFILVYFIVIPINLGFDMNFWDLYEESSPGFSSFFRSISIYFFFADIGVNFNTAIYRKGKLETDRKIIARNYIGKQFFRDLLSTAFLVIEFYRFDRQYEFLRWIGVLFITRIFTISDILHRMENYLFNDDRIQNTMLLINLITRMLVISHIFACSWHYVAYIQSTNDTWLHLAKIQNEDWLTKYLYSFYYVCVTMNTVGFGDIHPNNLLEVIYTIFFVYFACGIFAFNLNSVGIIVQNINKRRNMFKQNLTLINGYMIKKEINQDLRVKIRKYLEYIWLEEKTQTVEEETKIISKLSESLKEELLLEANGKILKNIPYFSKNFSEELLRKTVNVIQEVRFTPEDLIFMKDDYEDNSLYIVRKGEVEIFVITPRQNQPMTTLKKLTNGDVFGELSFFTGLGRKACARSTDFTSLYRIRQEDFLNLMVDHPEDFEKFCMMRDKIILYKSLEEIDLVCYSCNIVGHVATECPLLHFSPSREVIIHRHAYNEAALRAVHQRRKESAKYNALKNKYYVKDEVENFRGDYDISFNSEEEEPYEEPPENTAPDSDQQKILAPIKELNANENSENSGDDIEIEFGDHEVDLNPERQQSRHSVGQKGEGVDLEQTDSDFSAQLVKKRLSLPKSKERKRRRSFTEVKLLVDNPDEGTKKSEKSEFSKMSGFSPDPKLSIPPMSPFPKNNQSQFNFIGGIGSQLDLKEILQPEEERSRRKDNRMPSLISSSPRMLKRLGSLNSVNSNSSVAVNKKMTFLQGQMFEETYDKEKNTILRIPITRGGERKATKTLNTTANNSMIQYQGIEYSNNVNNYYALAGNTGSTNINSGGPNNNYNNNMLNSTKNFIAAGTKSINPKENSNLTKHELNYEMEMAEFLLQLDVMKRFKVYFRHNNIENVIRMYEDPSETKRKKPRSSGRFIQRGSILKGRNSKNMINLIQKKQFFKQDTDVKKQPHSPLKRDKYKKHSSISTPGKTPPHNKTRIKFSEFLFNISKSFRRKEEPGEKK